MQVNSSGWNPLNSLKHLLNHPAFWPGFSHNEGDYGLFFEFNSTLKGAPIPWETTQLNVTEGYTFDYTYIGTDDPPKFENYDFEVFDWKDWGHYGTRNWHLPLVVGALYLITIFGLERYMKNRPAFSLKYPLFMWNLALGIFSIIGFIRVAPEFISILFRDKEGIVGGFYKGICYRNGGNWPMAWWSLAFVLSKYLELGDTIFIVLRKRPLVFIQWYHHLVTLAMSWLTAPYVEPISRWYVVMNYFVHSLMYPYFALSVLGVKIPRKISVTITTFQLTQMIIGLIVNFTSAFLIKLGVPCYRHPFSVKMSFIVYGTFTFLFAKLYFDVVNKNKVQANAKPKSKSE